MRIGKRKEKHLFFVQSDFHYMICESIIKQNELNKEQCYFASKRGVKIGNGEQQYTLPLEGGLMYYLSHRKEVESFYKDCDVTYYVPFRGYPRERDVKNLVFFEEGLSAFCVRSAISENRQSRSKRERLFGGIRRKFRVYLTRLLVKKDMLQFIDGIYYRTDDELKAKMQLYVCSSRSYEEWAHPLMHRTLLKINAECSEKYNVKQGDCLLVLDRFSKGAVHYPENHIKCVRAMLEYCKMRRCEYVWVKFHPGDFGNKDVKRTFEECARKINLKIQYFDGRLEYLALQNIGVHFVSIHSTILFYAPMLGDSNKSISFVRYMYEIDNKYKEHIQLYGGIERFLDFFSERVECLEP